MIDVCLDNFLSGGDTFFVVYCLVYYSDYSSFFNCTNMSMKWSNDTNLKVLSYIQQKTEVDVEPTSQILPKQPNFKRL